ncbi:MAG TPA: hypothetical protein ENH24_03415 [Nitrospirae bacterium]|nr:hypothetical protein [Nitrospirota bacterium]
MKKPRLFYWKDAEDAWCPAEGLNLSDIVSLDIFVEGEEIEIRFKRLDMYDLNTENLTDDEYDNLPER